MNLFPRLRLAICFTLFAACNTASAQLININWIGLGDGTTWEDANNWSPNIVPNAANHVAKFDSVTGTIQTDGSSGRIIGLVGSNLYFSNVLIEDVSPDGVSLAITDQDDAGNKFDNSTVTIDLPITLDTGPGNVTVVFNLGSSSQFGFTSVTFMQPITTNGNNIVVLTPDADTAVLKFDQDFAGGNTGDVSLDGTASVSVTNSLTADDIHLTDGSISLSNNTSQLNANTLTLNRGSITVKGDSTPTNPIPILASNIVSRGGRINLFEGKVAIPQGVTVGPGNTTIDLFNAIADEAAFAGDLLRLLGGTVSVRANGTAKVKFSSAQGADVNGVLRYAIYNNSDFTLMNTATGELVRLTSYTPIASAAPDDAAQAVGNVTLSSNVDVSVFKLNNANLNGGGNTITADAVLVKGVNAAISNATLMPHDQPGTGPNELIIHAPVGGDRLNLDAVITDNIDPTTVTINAPEAGRVTVNSASTYTGNTNINSGTVILNGQAAGLGSGDVYLAPGSLLRLINNAFPQNVTFGTGPFPAEIEADGASTISGNIIVEVNSANDRNALFTALQSNDSLTINGTIARGGTGNPIERHGMSIVQVGETFGDGDITIGNTADFTDPNIVTTLNGDGGRNITVNGQLGPTVILGDVGVAGIGSATIFTDVRMDGTTSGATHSLAPGASIGTFTVVQDLLMRGSNFTYKAEVDDAGGSDLIAVGELFDISTPTDTLDISFFTGTTLASGDYTLATYGSRVDVFETVVFDGTPIADPTAPGAIGGTHRLLYGANSLLLTMSAGVPGDYNNNGIVDAADYVVWRKGLGTIYTQNDYDVWRAHFGQSSGAGAGGGSGLSEAAVPEPATSSLLLFALSTIALGWRRR
jgi:autotransporter-associated beta strand protein